MNIDEGLYYFIPLFTTSKFIQTDKLILMLSLRMWGPGVLNLSPIQRVPYWSERANGKDSWILVTSTLLTKKQKKSHWNVSNNVADYMKINNFQQFSSRKKDLRTGTHFRFYKMWFDGNLIKKLMMIDQETSTCVALSPKRNKKMNKFIKFSGVTMFGAW